MKYKNIDGVYDFMENKGELNIVVGDITDVYLLNLADAVVLPTNPMMRCGAGVSGAIFRKAGVDDLEEYTEKTFGISYYDETRKNEMKPTEVRVTPGFALPCQIIFAQGPRLYDFDDYQLALSSLLKTYENILQKAVECCFKTILVPPLGTGSYDFTHEDTVSNVIETIGKFLRQNELEVNFVVQSDGLKKLYM